MNGINRRDFVKWSLMGLLVNSPMTYSMNRTARHTVPAEEGPHELTFMQWPVSRQVHPDRAFLRLLQDRIAAIANIIGEFEPVIMLGASEHHGAMRRKLSSNVELWNVPTDDLWCRDSGPLFALDENGDRLISHIRFNGWGGKQVHGNDGAIVEKVADVLQVPIVDSGLWGEAGGVEHDGHGLLIAHESSWVNENRNPGLSREDIEQRLLTAYGAETMIWSSGVWGEDITDYHIDSLARLTSPARVLINLPDDPDMQDPFHLAAMETHDRIVDAGIEVQVIPEPSHRRVKSIDFVASYANYYVCNGGIIAAEFGDAETDAIAFDALEQHYPDREVVTLNVDALGEVGGGIHCATQQMPKSS